MRIIHHRDLLPVALILAVAALGTALMVYATRWGPIVHSDGVVYLLSADNLSRGGGLGITWGSGQFRYMSGFAPFYSLVVAGLEAAGMNMIAAARLVSVVCFGALVLVAGILGMRCTRSGGLGLALSLFVATSPQLLRQFATAASEGVYYVTGFSGLLLVLIAEESMRRWQWALAAVLIGLACLSRYVGISLVLTACVFVMFAAGRPSWSRLGRSAFLAGVALAMLSPWLAWTRAVSGNAAGKGMHAIGNVWSESQGLRLAAVNTLWKWVPFSDSVELAYRAKGAILLSAGFLILCCAAGAIALAVRRPALRPRVLPLARWTLVSLLWAWMHFGVHAAAYLAVSPAPDVNDRLLTPMHIGGIMAALGVTWLALGAIKPRILAPALAVVVAGLIILPTSGDLLGYAESLHREGAGFTSAYWRASQTVAKVDRLPEGTPIISNSADALLFLTRRPTYWIPELINREPDPEFSRFGDHPERSEEEEAFRHRRGVLVVFPSIVGEFEELYGSSGRERTDAFLSGLDVHWSRGEYEGIYLYPANDG